jgi:hypothetical protein
MTHKPSGWNRLVARMRGEVPATALEAYRRASLPVFELFEHMERRRLECKIDGLDPWAVPPATRAAFLCAWNAFVLQTLGNDILDADYRGEPATLGYVPPVTADQVLRLYEDVEGWVNRAYQAQASPDFRLDVPVPAALPAWSAVEPSPDSHLLGMLQAMRAVREHAAGAVSFLPEQARDAEAQAQLNRIRQVHASAQVSARYAEELCGTEPLPAVYDRAEAHARRAIEQFYLLGQLVADPDLALGPAPVVPALPGADGGEPPRLPARAVPRKDVEGLEGVDAELMRTVMDPAAPLVRRKIALIRLGWGPIPTERLVRLYRDLDERPLRERLLYGLSVRPDDAAVELLASVARDPADPFLRRTALYWLRASTHARAPGLLAELAEA